MVPKQTEVKYKKIIFAESVTLIKDKIQCL